MQTIVTTSAKEARRSRIAQFSGAARTLELSGIVITGIVRSVRKLESSQPTAWQITVRRTQSNDVKVRQGTGA